MSKVALISSFCDNKEKLDVLENNIKIIKSHNLDVIVISPFYLPKYIVDLCDYFFVTKDNPVFDWPQKAMFYWTIFQKGEKTYRISRTYGDYGYAGLYQIKQLSEIALNLKYIQFYHMIYDLKIDDNVIEGFYSEKICNVYPSKRGNTIWAVGLHYMIFDRENLKNFVFHISEENYKSQKGGDAFVWLHNRQDVFNYTIEKTPVEDHIYFYENHDFINYSPIEDFKFFVEKNDETLSSIKLLFYNLPSPKQIILSVDGEKTIHTIDNYDLIDLGFNKFNMKSVVLENDGVEYDLTESIEKIKHNVIQEV
jgi:hypothetical protein